MGLDKGEKLQAVGLITLDGLIVHGVNRSGTEVAANLTKRELQRHIMVRARKGVALEYRMKPMFLEPVLPNNL